MYRAKAQGRDQIADRPADLPEATEPAVSLLEVR
jgi:hypothetical protein